MGNADWSVHRFIFEEKENAVLLTSSEAFRGPLLWLSKLIFIPKRLHRLTQQLMASIKNQAEACVGQPESNWNDAAFLKLFKRPNRRYRNNIDDQKQYRKGEENTCF